MSKKSFDLESVYDAEIAPLMTQIIEICHKHKLPMFATFLCMNDPDESGDDLVCTTSLLFKERPIPDKMMSLPGIILSAKRSALRLRVTKADGSIEETIVL